MKPVLIFGAGQIAQVFAAYLEENDYDVAAFVVDTGPEADTGFDAPVLPTEGIEKRFPPTRCSFVVGMSFKKLSAPRAAKFDLMRMKGYEPLTFIDRRARVDSMTTIGRGSFIMDGNTIQPFAMIGENTIIWSGNHIGHHSRIGKHVFVASHAVISGAVDIGDYSFVGVNATIRDNVKVGERCVIGAGALILTDCECDGVYAPGGTERSRVPSHRLRRI